MTESNDVCRLKSKGRHNSSNRTPPSNNLSIQIFIPITIPTQKKHTTYNMIIFHKSYLSNKLIQTLFPYNFL